MIKLKSTLFFFKRLYFHLHLLAFYIPAFPEFQENDKKPLVILFEICIAFSRLFPRALLCRPARLRNELLCYQTLFKSFHYQFTSTAHNELLQPQIGSSFLSQVAELVAATTWTIIYNYFVGIPLK